MFKVKYFNHFKHNLGYPYDTFTCSENRGTFDTCFERCCNRKSIKKFDKILHDLDIFKPYDRRHVSYADVLNLDVSRSVDNILSDCVSICSERDCDIEYTMTDYADDVDLAKREIIFQVTTPSTPDISIEFSSKVSFLDLFVYVMGAISAWFGLAVINFDPIKYYYSFKNHFFQAQETPVRAFTQTGASMRQQARTRRKSSL